MIICRSPSTTKYFNDRASHQTAASSVQSISGVTSSEHARGSKIFGEKLLL